MSSRLTWYETLILGRAAARLMGVPRPPVEEVVQALPEPDKRAWEDLTEEDRDVISGAYDEPTEELHREQVDALLHERDMDPEDRLQ